MKKQRIFSIIFVLSISLCFQIAATEGFYKTIFMDGGVGFNGMKTLPAADYLGFSFEYIATNDVDYQNKIMIKNENDDNGALLYPDNEPRFQAIFSNGGGMNQHGTSLGEEGLGRVRTFYYNGGSYTGACAGAYIATIDSNIYYNIWPGSMIGCGIANTTVGGVIPPDSPLLNYYDFGGDNYIPDIVHVRGGYASTLPPGTEVLLIHDKPDTELDGKPSSWAYKDNDTTGRTVVMSSHPENEFSGERRDFMAGVLQYAIDGGAPPGIKGSLASGITRIMNKSTKDSNPEYTKIGDKQYHHFTVTLAGRATNLVLTLDGNDGFDLNLYVKKDTFAFAGLAEYSDTSQGADKTISLDSLASGTWYVGVECATTVEAKETGFGYEYSGKLEVLNGIEYSIQADWNISDIYTENALPKGTFNQLTVNVGRNSVAVCVRNKEPYKLRIYNVKGELCWEPNTFHADGKYLWQPKSTGMYIVFLESGRDILTERFTVVQ